MTVREDADLNFPFVLKRATVTQGHVMVGQWPTLSMGKVDVTGHDSGGVEESMPDGLLRATPIELTLIPASGVMTTLRGDLSAKTVSTWAISDDVDTATFSGWVQSIGKPQADANKPDAVKYTIVLQPTSTITWS